MAAPITDSGKLPPELFSHLMFPRIIIHQPCLFVLFFIPERHRFCKCIRGIKEVSSQDRIAHNFVFISLQKGPSELHRHQLRKVIRAYDALTKKGYNPVNQIVGYILSEDPTYITTYNNARTLIRHIDRDELLQALVKSYLNQ